MSVTIDSQKIVSYDNRVPILPLDLASVEDVKVNRSAVERRAATMNTRHIASRPHD
jgi:hypothetical protein